MKYYKTILSLIVIAASVINIFNGCGYNMGEIYEMESAIAESNDTFDLEKRSEVIEDNIYEGEYKLDGYGLIWSYVSEEDKDINVPYHLNVISGKAKLVLITDDNTVTTLVENDSNSAIQDETLEVHIKKGTNRIKIVGYKANINISLNIDDGDFTTIGVNKE